MQRYTLSDEGAAGLVCQKTDRGYTWTLATVMRELLTEAERRYGPRDTSYTLYGVEFGPDVPKLWFPGNAKDVVVQIGAAAKLQPSRAVYQLAHEVVHLLAPATTALTVEEGVATVFCDEVGAYQLPTWRTDDPNYQAAGHLVRTLLADDPDAVRKLRTFRPRFGDWTADFLIEHYPTLDEDVARALCEPFAGAVPPPTS